MASSLFTALTASEEANLSGGQFNFTNNAPGSAFNFAGNSNVANVFPSGGSNTAANGDTINGGIRTSGITFNA